MALYVLGEVDRLRFERRAQWSCCSEPYKDGYFRLFNKNALKTTFVKIVGQTTNYCAWLVEATEPIDPYFKNVLKNPEIFSTYIIPSL